MHHLVIFQRLVKEHKKKKRGGGENRVDSAKEKDKGRPWEQSRAALSVRIYRRAVPAADLRKIGSPFVAISCNLNKHSLKNTGAIRTLLHTSISVSTILRGRDLKIISRLKR
ncbi:AFH_G0008220.mRNA.1.CDS.1 [Saccharomyces cerevisiae]|nr:ABH_G0007990.mRNA.1.CDS.1 [Saccharomyces cerevisiae]CAI4322716.1 ADQ_G0008100.mRNA.1.CDS.1 [Saccharomyces cerevisiae]CAI4324776.1 CLN_G0008140.mRNA.1.CDS.1 [Saccharomyces cerevisiae]CAI4871641.1 AFH_G0008220.mRNA.1.CDS.1 [Saccharomyces cerevisiae]CAI5245062.1 CMF_HP2_G0008040.mRNA.1.CDS.1 [Saccharomyces cerevisiae]